MSTTSKPRIWAMVCMAAMIAFFVLAIHAHLDSQQDMKCPACQAGSLHASMTPVAGVLQVPEVSVQGVPLEIAAETSSSQWSQHAPRPPPV